MRCKGVPEALEAAGLLRVLLVQEHEVVLCEENAVAGVRVSKIDRRTFRGAAARCQLRSEVNNSQ